MILYAILTHTVFSSIQIDPLYWNASNPIFSNGLSAHLDVHFGEKLDIYCPQRNADSFNGQEPMYLKVFLVPENSYQICSTDHPNAKKIFVCNAPEQEKKHTMLFQEINPNPFGLKFKQGQDYFIISTADGTPAGLDLTRGGVCDKHNMKIKIRVSDFADLNSKSVIPSKMVTSPYRPKLSQWDETRKIEEDLREELESEEIELAQSSGFTIGIIIGAFTVLILIIAGVIGYRWQSRRGDIRKALYIPRPRPASSQVHLTLVPAGTQYPYDQTRKQRPMSGFISQNGMLNAPVGNIYNPTEFQQAPQEMKKGSPSGTYSSRQDSLGENSMGSELTYLDPGTGGVVEV